MRLVILTAALVIGLVLMTIAQINNTSSNTIMQKGVEYLDSHQYNKALVQFEKVLRRDSKNIEAHENCGEAHLLLNDYRAALIDYKTILLLDPDNAGAYCGLATSNEKLGNFKYALEAYGKSIKLDPNFAIAYHNRAILREKLGDRRCAIDYKKASELGYPDKWVID